MVLIDRVEGPVNGMAPWVVGRSTEEMEVQVLHWADIFVFVIDNLLLTFTTCAKLVERMLQ